jgi:hypothetical protein
MCFWRAKMAGDAELKQIVARIIEVGKLLAAADHQTGQTQKGTKQGQNQASNASKTSSEEKK